MLEASVASTDSAQTLLEQCFRALFAGSGCRDVRGRVRCVLLVNSMLAHCRGGGECVVCQLTDLQMHVVSTMLDARRAVWGVEALGVQG